MTVHVMVVVRGLVQGVGFRNYVAHNAERRGLEGFVRNRRDGAVEAVFAGPEPVVAEMVALCRRGPRGARVDEHETVPVTEAALAQRRKGKPFEVLPTL